MTSTTQTESIVLTPIGIIRNSITKPSFSPEEAADIEERKQQVRRRHRKVKETISELIIDPAYGELLDGIDAFSHILVLYWPHLLAEGERALRKVHPMGRKDIPEQGIFATRSPARPNPVLVTTVRLLEHNGNILRVQGLEALDRSPILDLKPVTRRHESIEKPRFPDWIKQIREDLEEK